MELFQKCTHDPINILGVCHILTVRNFSGVPPEISRLFLPRKFRDFGTKKKRRIFQSVLGTELLCKKSRNFLSLRKFSEARQNNRAKWKPEKSFFLPSIYPSRKFSCSKQNLRAKISRVYLLLWYLYIDLTIHFCRVNRIYLQKNGIILLRFL